MKCEEIRRFAHLYIDGEFDEREKGLFAEHLSACPQCTREVKALAVFQEALRRKMAPAAVPADVRDRLAASLHRAAARAWPQYSALTVASAVAGVVLLAAATLIVWQAASPGDDFSQLMEESVTAHEAGLPPEAEGEKVEPFVAQAVQMPAEEPLHDDGALKLQGVRLTHVGNAKAILYRYLHRGHAISVVQIPKVLPALAAREDLKHARRATRVLFVGPHRGHPVTVYDGRRFRNAVVSDIPQKDLVKLIPASL
jgi:hypothetical protein